MRRVAKAATRKKRWPAARVCWRPRRLRPVVMKKYTHRPENSERSGARLTSYERRLDSRCAPHPPPFLGFVFSFFGRGTGNAASRHTRPCPPPHRPAHSPALGGEAPPAERRIPRLLLPSCVDDAATDTATRPLSTRSDPEFARRFQGCIAHWRREARGARSAPLASEHADRACAHRS